MKKKECRMENGVIMLEEDPTKYEYIDPPNLSDGIYTIEQKEAVEEMNTTVCADMNTRSIRRWMKILGRRLYLLRNGVKKDNVMLRELPKGYALVQANVSTKVGVCGHPQSYIFRNLEGFLTHLLWLEDCSQRKVNNLSTQKKRCKCKKCRQDIRSVQSPKRSRSLYGTVPLPTLLTPNIDLLFEENK